MMIYLNALPVLFAVGLVGWLYSFIKRDASIVDILWGLFFIVAASVYAYQAGLTTARGMIVVALVTLWGLRLAGHITWRGLGEPEDRRYQAIRHRNNPNFEWKSLYLIFGFQALLAWIVSLPLLGGILGHTQLGWLDIIGIMVSVTGLVIETTADRQLAHFKAQPANQGRLMDSGLWRYSRQPNYFGDFLVWWGFFLIAMSAGAWWSLPGPLLMTFLLLRVSGVALLEQDLSVRKPEYAAYIKQTNAFFPGPVRGTPINQEITQ